MRNVTLMQNATDRGSTDETGHQWDDKEEVNPLGKTLVFRRNTAQGHTSLDFPSQTAEADLDVFTPDLEDRLSNPGVLYERWDWRLQ
jgi:hypothetical protein